MALTIVNSLVLVDDVKDEEILASINCVSFNSLCEEGLEIESPESRADLSLI